MQFLSRQLPKPQALFHSIGFLHGWVEAGFCLQLFVSLFLRDDDGSGMLPPVWRRHMVEFLSNYCVYGWGENIMCKIPPGVPTAAIWALVYRKEIGC
jgi:hypothetical protein